MNSQQPSLPLATAVFCGNCETITNSPHEACLVCGSPSLVSLVRILGGALHGQELQATGNPTMYSLELRARVNEIRVAELNVVLGLLSQLSEFGFTVESLHLCVQPVASHGTARAA